MNDESCPVCGLPKGTGEGLRTCCCLRSPAPVSVEDAPDKRIDFGTLCLVWFLGIISSGLTGGLTDNPSLGVAVMILVWFAALWKLLDSLTKRKRAMLIPLYVAGFILAPAAFFFALCGSFGLFHAMK